MRFHENALFFRASGAKLEQNWSKKYGVYGQLWSKIGATE
jgi:hypothetical protein